jgi:hypothetical protein
MSQNRKVTVPVGSPIIGERRPGTAATTRAPAANRSLNNVARSSRTSRPSSPGVRKYR